MRQAIGVLLVWVSTSLLAACTRPNPGFAGEDARPPPDQPGDNGLPADGRTGDQQTGDQHLGAPDLQVDRGMLADGSRGVDVAGPCAPSETYSGGHCYSVIAGAPMMYPSARQQCQKSGGLPASIGSAVEHTVVFGLIGSSSQGAWIGLLRTGPGKGDFAWEGGAPVGYTQWALGEPNNENGAENCVVVWGPAVSSAQLPSKWNDAPCHIPRDTVVCERTP